MQILWQDLRYALRTLSRSRGFAAAAILTLALGIGANSAIFSLVNGVLLRPLPYPAPEQLMTIWGFYPSTGRSTASLPDFHDWRERSRSFSDMAAVYGTLFTITSGGEPEQLAGSRVTANFFRMLGVEPALGRGFLPEEEQVGGNDDVVVLSHGLWQRRFGSDPSIVGRQVELNSRPYTVVGVAPANFRLLQSVDAWAPFRADTGGNRRSEYLEVYGRLKPGITPAQAQAELSGIARQLAAEYPETNASWTTLEVLPLKEFQVGDVRRALLVFSVAVGLVLLIACANVANLLLARAAAREREIAVRVALGAGRWRLMRQLLTESTLLAVIGGLAGVALATWAVDGLRVGAAGMLPRMDEVRVDGAAVAFSLGLSVLTGLLFGLVPALRVGSGMVHDTLREGTRGAPGTGVARALSGLVLGEVALAMVLLVGAGLLVRSFAELTRIDPGFQSKGVLTFGIILPPAKFPEPEKLPALYDRVLERMSALPGVSAVGLGNNLPMHGASYITFSIEGRVPPPDVGEDLQPFAVSPGHFRTLRIPLRSGRLLEPTDGPTAPYVAVVNEELVRRFLPGRDPLGARIAFGDGSDSTAWMTIVGVVGNVAQEDLAAKPYPQIYFSVAQAPRRSLWVSLRTAGDPLALAGAVRRALASVDPALPLRDLRTMDDRVAENIAQPRLSVAVLALFAGIALLLAAVGLYGVLSYAVAQRTREIGIRLALGADGGAVQRLIVRQGMQPALLGIAVGLGGAFALTRLMRSLLYGVSAADPLTYAGVALFLGAVALAAAWMPARRAARLDPISALRAE
jgi:putative ABC transport system permease protein